MSHTLQIALESEQEARIIKIDFSASFDRVNHLGILYKLCSVGIGGSVLSTLTVSIRPVTARYGTVVGVNWLILYQECHRALFLVRY